MEVVPLSSRERLALVAAFGAVYVVWGSTYLAIAWAIETVPPLLMIGARCLAAGAVLYGWARLRGGPRATAADWRAAAVAGVLLFVTGQALLAWSETRIPSGAASLLIATEPLFIALLGWRGGRLTGTAGAAPGAGALVAILVGFAGVGLLVLPGGGGGLDVIGAAAAVLASFSWSVGVYRAGSRPSIGAGQMAGMQLLAASVVLLVVSAAAGDLARLPAGGPSLKSLAAFGYLVVLGSIVAFGAYVWLLARVGPARLSTHAYVNPLVAVVLGVALNAEPVGAGLVAATVLILGSVALLLGAGRRGAPRSVGALGRSGPGERRGGDPSAPARYRARSGSIRPHADVGDWGSAAALSPAPARASEASLSCAPKARPRYAAAPRSSRILAAMRAAPAIPRSHR